MSNHEKSRGHSRGSCFGRLYRRSRTISISDRQLYRDKERGKIAGVCAGLADYFDKQIWIVRMLAITGLLFMPEIVFFAYLIAIVVVPTKEQLQRSREEELKDDVAQQRFKQSRFDKVLNGNEKFSLNAKRRTVRQFRDRFSKLDQRMQKLETYVTSSQFDLNRKFNSI